MSTILQPHCNNRQKEYPSHSYKRKAEEPLKSDRTKKHATDFGKRAKIVRDQLRSDLVCTFATTLFTSLNQRLCQGKDVELKDMQLRPERCRVNLLPRISDPHEFKKERTVISSITSEETGKTLFAQIFPQEVQNAEPLTKTLQEAIDCIERSNAKILSDGATTPEEKNQAIEAHAKARLLIYFLMGHVFYDLHNPKANIVSNGANLQIQRGYNGFEACHHSLFANLHNTSLLSLQDAFVESLERAVTTDGAKIDVNLIIKLLSLGIEGNKIQEVIDDVFKNAERVEQEARTHHRTYSRNPIWLDGRIGEIFKQLDHRSLLVPSAAQNIFNSRSNFLYLNNHTLLGWMVNQVDDYIEKAVRNIALEDLKDGRTPSRSAERVGNRISDALSVFIANMKEIFPIATDTDKKYRALEAITDKISTCEPQKLPIDLLEELNRANRALFEQNALLEGKLKNSLLPPKIKASVDQYLTRSKNHIAVIARHLEIVQKAHQRFSAEFRKQKENELNNSKTDFQHKISQSNKEIEAIKQEIEKRLRPYREQKTDFEGEVNKLGWNQIYEGQPTPQELYHRKEQIIMRIEGESKEHTKRFQRRLYENWSMRNKLLASIETKENEKARCIEELSLLNNDNNGGNPPSRGEFINFIKSDKEIQMEITESYSLLKRYFLGLMSQEKIHSDIGHQIGELISVAEIQMQATLNTVKEINNSYYRDNEISKIVMPYLLLRGVDPVVTQG